MNISFWKVNELLERVEFIKGNVIAREERHALQQLQELKQELEKIQEQIIKSGYPGR